MTVLSPLSSASASTNAFVNDAVSQISNQVTNFADQVANYSSIANAYTQAATQTTQNTVANLANQVASYSQSYYTPQYSPQIQGSSLLPQGQVSSQYYTPNLANQVAYYSQQYPQQNTDLLLALIQQIPSLVSSVANATTNPVYSAIDRLANQVSNFNQVNNSSLDRSLLDVVNNLNLTNTNLLGGLTREIDDLANTLADRVASSANRSTTDFTNLLSAVTTQNERNLSDTLSQVDRLANQVSDFSKDLVDGLQQSFSRDIDDFENKVNYVFSQVEMELPDWLKALAPFLTGIGGAIGGNLGKDKDQLLDYFQKRFTDIGKALEKLKRGEYKNPDDFFNDIFGKGISQDIVGFLINIIGLVPVLLQISQLSSHPILRTLEQLQNIKYPSFLLSPDAYVNWHLKHPENYDEYQEYLGKLGINPRQASILLQSGAQLVDLPMLVDWFLRDKSREDKFIRYMGKMNFENQEMNIIREVINVIPPLNDIITMAVREVFNPQKRQLQQLDNGFPEDVAKWAEKKGLSREWAMNYWASHWQPVSPNQAYEMYHRGIISKDTLRSLLEIADYPPGMIDNLIAISYNPLTRVDIRRMYKQGNMTYDQMVKAHQDIGLSPENARFLADFVVGSITDDDDKYTASVRTRVFNAVEKAFEDGTISREEAINAFQVLQLSGETANEIVNLVTYEKQVLQRKQENDTFNNHAIALIKSSFQKGALPRQDAKMFLTALGISEQDAERQLNLLELERQIKLKGIAEDTAKTLYGQYKIDQTEMYTMLDNLGFTPQEKYFIFYEADLARKKKTKMLTEKQYEKLYKDGLITESEYYDNLRGIGYTDKDATYLVTQDIMALGA